MKKKKTSRYYQDLRYQQDQAQRERTIEKTEPTFQEIRRFRFLRIVLLPNLTNLLLNNLSFLLTCIPAFLFLELTLQTGGLILLAGVWLSMGLLFPGLTALYHRSYDYTRRIPASVRTSFIAFFLRNFKLAAPAGLLLGFLWTLCFFYMLMAQVWIPASLFYYLFVLIPLFLTCCYAMTVMVQLSDLAAWMSYSQSYFCRKFRTTFNCPFQQYLCRYRLSKARLLLAQEHISVEETARRVGFNHTGYFVRQFHATYGCTPRQFQKSQAKENVFQAYQPVN